MKCSGCGAEFEGNFCPECGKAPDEICKGDSPENFYRLYRKYNTLEMVKKIVGIIKQVVWILSAVVFVGLILLLVTDVQRFPEIFGYDVHSGTDEEMFAFIYKLFLLIGLSVFIPLTIACIWDILDWASMSVFSSKIANNHIDGISLLTQSRLSDKRGKKEYIFISNSLCMIDEPSQKIIIGIKVILKTILNIALFVAVINLISYLTFTLMPDAEDDLTEMIYTDNEFWLDPNILLWPVMFWANIIINSVMSLIANRKYTRWVKNNNMH